MRLAFASILVLTIPILCLIKWHQKYHIKSACKEIMR
jgi:hypothetical protein